MIAPSQGISGSAACQRCRLPFIIGLWGRLKTAKHSCCKVKCTVFKISVCYMYSKTLQCLYFVSQMALKYGLQSRLFQTPLLLNGHHIKYDNCPLFYYTSMKSLLNHHQDCCRNEWCSSDCASSVLVCNSSVH